MRLLVACSLLFLIPSLLNGQRADHWYFGEGCALSFTTGIPTIINGSQLFAEEGCASISDKHGNLLFYTDGVTVWNKDHQKMVNGTGLWGHQSSSQSALIVPKPNNDSIYYVFTLDAEAQAHGLSYSIVDVTKNNNVGELIQKNITLYSPSCEKVTAVRHCNKKDIWLITHKWNSNEFASYLISELGINTAPMLSSVGSTINGAIDNTHGYLKCSPDGRKIAIAHNGSLRIVELFDFNNKTGELTNPIRVYQRLDGNESEGVYGLEFSPDSKLLYAGTSYLQTASNYAFDILQYEINLPDPMQIINSKKVIATTPNYVIGALQLAVDGKLYISVYNQSFLARIEMPNAVGPGCNFNLNAVQFPGKLAKLGLPNFIQNYFELKDSGEIVANGNCMSSMMAFQTKFQGNVDSVRWNFGDPNSGAFNISNVLSPTHQFTRPDQFLVTLILYRTNACSPDTIYKRIYAGPLRIFLGNDSSLCYGDTLKLKVDIPNSFITWSNNSHDSLLYVTTPGKYIATVSVGDCHASDTIEIEFKDKPAFSLGNDASICANEQVTLMPTPAFTNSTYLWNTGAITPQIDIFQPGLYWLRITDALGCSNYDSILMTNITLPGFSLGEDKIGCMGEFVKLETSIPNARYLWSTGDTTKSIQVSNNGSYWIDLALNQCHFKDTIQVSFNPVPLILLGNDTTICEDQELTLHAGNPGANYIWNDGSTAEYLSVSSTGSYFVKVDLNGCKKSDTILIFHNYKPRFTLGSDLEICPGMNLELKPSQIQGTLQWQNGSTTTILRITNPGLYYLDMRNTCGITRDSLLINEGNCKIRVPNAFTPDGNGKNDVLRVLGLGLSDFEFIVYNRWGQQVFRTTDQMKGWDGRVNGFETPPGTYAYIVTYKEFGNNELKVAKGHFVLIR